MNKKAISLMVSYVLLIIIAITLSIFVYTWLKGNVPKDTEKCEADVSLIIESYSCSNNKFEITVKNAGFFSVDGFYLRVSNHTDGTNKYSVSGGGGEKVVYDGQAPIDGKLKPGQTYELKSINYPEVGGSIINKITHIEVEPYLLKNNKVVLCGEGVVKINTDQESGCLGT